MVEPCWYFKLDDHGNTISQILVEVDDFIVSSKPSYDNTVRSMLENRFKFGKWEDDEAEYAGRHITCEPGQIRIQQTYIMEQVFPIALGRGRKASKDSLLTKEEFMAFRSLTYKLNWLGRGSRPEVAGTASIMASRLPAARVSDIITVNKLVNYLRSTADREIIIWAFD